MLRIQRALVVELIVSFAVVLTVVTGAVFLGSALIVVNDGGGALGTTILMSLMPLIALVALAYSVPFSWLAAVALVVGRWVSDHEITALESSGVRAATIGVPVLALSALLGLAAMAYNGYVVPAANRAVRTNVQDLAPQFLSSLRGADRSIALSNGRLSFTTWSDGFFHDVELDRRDHTGVLRQKVIARRVRLEPVGDDDGDLELVMEFQDAVVLKAARGGGWEESEQPTARIQMARVVQAGASTRFNQFFMTDAFRYKPKDMVLPELIYVIHRGGVRRGNVQRARIALHGRLSLGAASFSMGAFALGMLLLIAPPGRRVRDFMLCFVPCVLVFFPLYVAGSTFARHDGAPPWLAMWAPNILLTAAAALMLVGRRR